MKPHLVIDNKQEPFEQFWRAYPRKVGKGAARKAFKKALTLATVEDILAGVQAARTYWERKEEDIQFIPHPATWLNQERWDDEYPEVKPVWSEKEQKWIRQERWT